MANKQDWTAWNQERSNFQERDSEGFIKDLEAFQQHIKNLSAISPKDKAGWPVGLALQHITKLQMEYNKFKAYLALNH